LQVAVYKSDLVDQYLTFAVFLSRQQVDLVLLNASWKWKGGNLSLSKFTNCVNLVEDIVQTVPVLMKTMVQFMD
jgi:hypothetical protein